jgi:ElaA protein
MKKIQWQLKVFDDLSTVELYSLLKLRSDVFVVEQNCVYPDIDNKDQGAWHLMGYLEGEFVAYARFFVCGEDTAINRIVVHPRRRGEGLGQALMHEAMRVIATQAGWSQSIYLMAQKHLEHFYQSFGFESVSEPYDEDGIPHIDMRRPALSI